MPKNSPNLIINITIVFVFLNTIVVVVVIAIVIVLFTICKSNENLHKLRKVLLRNAKPV